MTTCDDEISRLAEQQLARASEDIDIAIHRLETFMNSLNLMDIRHDDFASDACLVEHLKSLKAISKSIFDSSKPWGARKHLTRNGGW